jgi:type I restriction enzyme S subunit
VNPRWATKSLGDICDFQGGSQPPKSEFVYQEKSKYVRFLQIRDFGSDKNITYIPVLEKNRMCEEDDILIGRYGASVGKILTGKAGAYNVALMKTTPNLEVVDRSWFHNYLISDEFQERLRNVAERSAQNGFSKEDIFSFPVPVPPLPEQKRIVGILDKAFEGIAKAKANAERNLQNARALFESHLEAIFTQREKGWLDTTLEKMLAVQPRNGWSPPAAHHSDMGVPVLTLSSVTGFQFRPDKIKFTSAPTNPRRHYWIKNEDFLITRSNTPELVGHVAIAFGITKPTIYPDLIMRMNPAPDRMMTEFLYYQMRTPSLRKEITSRAQGANPTMKKISKGAVQTLPIRVPSISVQKQIVTQLNSLTAETHRLESICQKKLAALEELKRSLLHQAFSGGL